MTDSHKKVVRQARQKQIRVRIAPSPTGFLHLGTARSALFNWLFAKNQGGIFILRVEDTDLERSDPKYEKDIVENLQWLGLDWDEGPYRQSERLDIYEKYIKKLLQENKAYYCFCAKEELEEEKEAMLSQGLSPKYSGKCRHNKNPDLSRPSVIRFKMPETEVIFHDLIRGKVKFNTGLIGDIVIAKELRAPLYNLAVVIDDFEMKISHVIRGEDHISNTPKQIMLQNALGFEEPVYAHLPLILSPDRSKLSKRYLETSIDDYRREGYLPEALINFLALMGWHPEEDREVLSMEELVNEFSLKRIQKGGAVFNLEKLDWLNGQYIMKLKPEELARRLENFIPRKWLEDRGFLVKIVEIEKERIKKLTDFSSLVGFFFELPDYPAKLLIWDKTPKEDILGNLRSIFSLARDFAEAENKIMALAESRGRGETLWPFRTALSGQIASTGPFEIMKVLGKEETLKRLEIAISKLMSN
ncbi:glutamate--tRNA ligase [Candidatus Jorgensenbacteria bacterium RIFCSPLOWO2_12_FULL_42_11]|uniref:Glutamate--tRNA ligase n=1 Tax=Candidatus Jorgensenbacteria bacterium RIFCSPLOWO2_12_FULL_42_11 TaxID=1798473 RepID=A0A1F6C0S7_9BACT|nr:MAG: glutamate--tRNA ligase [Candidatus Jorgensenbacteria bacterium RIFCSPLOWO2_12_FULL_42_11]